MGWSEAGSMEIKDKTLVEKIKSCMFRDPELKLTEEEWNEPGSYRYYYIDLAKFLGIRETLEHTPEDTELNDEEYEKLVDIIGYKECRGIFGYVFDWDDKKGSATLTLSGWKDYPRGLFSYISKMYPEEHFEVNEWWDCDFDDDDPGYADYLLVDGKWYDDEKDYENDMTYDRGMAVANEGKYQEAIEVLTPLIQVGNNSAICNIGVCYERIGNLEMARDLYKKSQACDAKLNLLRLYDNNRIAFEKDDYIEACNYLMERNWEEGFLYLAYYYENKEYGELDIGKAIDLIKIGMEKCKDVKQLMFEFAYLLETQSEFEDQYKAHAFYQMLLHTDFVVAQYNYALQCLQGRGCDKDIDLAIKWFTVSAEGNYVPAMEKLVGIYGDEKTKDLEKLNYWNDKIKENN